MFSEETSSTFPTTLEYSKAPFRPLSSYAKIRALAQFVHMQLIELPIIYPMVWKQTIWVKWFLRNFVSDKNSEFTSASAAS